MAEYVDFHYTPLEGRITGKQVLKQTEDAINDLGNRVYNAEVTSEDVQEALDNSQQAIDIANDALAAVTTDKAVWFNNVADMIAANLVNGNVAATKGYTLYNDGNGAFYAIRQKKGGDVDDGINIIFLDNGSVAERINEFNLIAKKSIIHVVNVAELKASDGKIDSVYGTLGYYTANDGGAGIYTIRAMTASDVENGGSIIFLSNGNVAELIPYGTVCPEQFGAYGDGVHDDRTAIVNAIAFLQEDGTLVANKTYRFTTGFSIEKSINVITNGSFLYDNTEGTAITLGNSLIKDLLFKKCYLKFKVDAVNISWNTQTEFVGIKAINVMEAELHISVSKFETGFWIYGDGADCDYNKIFIDTIYNCKNAIIVNTNDNLGYTNQNTFIGGRIGNSLSSVSLLGENDKVCPLSILGTYANNNAFYSVSFEANGGTKTNFIVRGRFNYLLCCRYEGIQNFVLEGSFNKIWQGFGMPSDYVGSLTDGMSLQTTKVNKLVTEGNHNLVLKSTGLAKDQIEIYTPTNLKSFDVSWDGKVWSGTSRYLIRNTSADGKEFGYMGDPSVNPITSNVDAHVGSFWIRFDGSGKDICAFVKGVDTWRNVLIAMSLKSTSRPTSGIVAGYMVFDTTLGKPIWWNGSDWVDATGTVV